MTTNEVERTYSTEDLKKEVARLVNTYPNTVYSSKIHTCFYTKVRTESGEGCLFGQAITNLYPELKPKLEEIDRGIKSGCDNNGEGYRIETILEMFEFEPWEGANDIQDNQDTHHKWCECIE
jgi:hypothetical protein